MKQHITTDQIQELTLEEAKYLRKWWIPKPSERSWEWKVSYSSIFQETFPLLTVGHMIEFLNENAGDYDLEIHINNVGSSVWFSNGRGQTIRIGYNPVITCDALWEAVKYVLKEKCQK